MAKVLIIDDDEMFCEMLSDMIRDMGHEVKYTHSLGEGVKEALSGAYDVAFLDVRMPDGSGLNALPRIRESADPPEVIIITGAGDPDGAELAIVNGAWDYIEKQSSIKRMILPLVRALQYREEKKAKKPLMALKLDGIVGQNPKMRSCYDLLAQAADSEANVLIYGETGTGKELFARAIHANSRRRNREFVVVDCAALPESLVESALFGYEKGAFTGADKSQTGLIKQADGGTLFLDEVGELPLTMQKAFLRVLQERRFRPLGARQEVESNFRLVAATNRDLDRAVAEGTFRRDLLFRLRALTINLPPLREHLDDIKELVLYHTGRLCEAYGIPQKGFAPEFFDCLMAYDWPGNVRELVNTLDRALAEARHEPTLFPSHLPSYIRVKAVRHAVGGESAGVPASLGLSAPGAPLPRLREVREAAIAQAEKQYLEELLAIAKNDLKEACRISALSQPRLYALLKKHRIRRPRTMGKQ
jgi:two-component system NtrC family response regulator|uniref:Sigma-54-dependent Fis family transcriptional regulator n=1 Tax=Desulfobacca acetoxidans TaxID=60893 RepID=A0A7C5AK36_9BACT